MKLNQVLLAIVSLIIATMLWLQVQSQGEPFTQRVYENAAGGDIVIERGALSWTR